MINTLNVSPQADSSQNGEKFDPHASATGGVHVRIYI